MSKWNPGLTKILLSLDMADFRKCFAKAKHIVVISGAGISAESGVPTFRGAGGYWRKWKAQVGNVSGTLKGSFWMKAFNSLTQNLYQRGTVWNLPWPFCPVLLGIDTKSVGFKTSDFSKAASFLSFSACINCPYSDNNWISSSKQSGTRKLWLA